ncbi:MAG: TlpA family protein disulfide reductase [Dehalococcoidia bacterium]
MQDEAPPEQPQPGAGSSGGMLGYLALAVALILAIGVGAYLFVSGGDDSPDIQLSDLDLPTPLPNTGPIDPQRPNEGEPAPDFALVDARDPGKIIKLSDYRGKAVILNWYASWCGPCKSEIPAFVKAQEKLGDQLVILGVDYLEKSDAATSILDEFGASYPAVLDSSGEVADHYRTGLGVPVTFFIDKDGVLQTARRGEVYEKDLPDYLAKLGITYSVDQ